MYSQLSPQGSKVTRMRSPSMKREMSEFFVQARIAAFSILFAKDSVRTKTFGLVSCAK